MKKKVIIFISLVLLCGVTYTTVHYILGNTQFKEPDYSDDAEESIYDAPGIREVTYRFSGKSDHFSFSVGMVDLEDDYSAIHINDFKQDVKIDGLKEQVITVLFDNKEWSSQRNNTKFNKIGKRIKIGFYEAGILCTEESGMLCEKTVFSTTATKENFKDVFEVKVQYCLDDGECVTENFEITYK